MIETTISLSDDSIELAKRQAMKRGVAVSEILRDAVEIGLAANSTSPTPDPKQRTRDPLFAAEFVFEDDLPADLSEHFSRYSTDLAVKKHERSERP